MSESNDVDTHLPIAKLCIYNVASGVVDTIWQASPLLVFDLAWGPEDDWLVFASDVGIHKINRMGDSLTFLAASEFARQPCWLEGQNRILYVVNSSPDGGVFSVVQDGDSIHRVSPANLAITSIGCSAQGDSLACAQIGTSYCLSVYGPSASFVSDTVLCGLSYADHVEMSPDGSTLFLFGRPTSSAGLGLYSVGRSSSQVRFLAKGYTFDISPDGNSLVYSDAENTKRLRVLNLQSEIDTFLIGTSASKQSGDAH